jgi:hypothetical protein
MFYSRNKVLTIKEVTDNIEELSRISIQELKSDINNHELNFNNEKLIKYSDINIKTNDNTFIKIKLSKLNVDTIINLSYTITLFSDNFDTSNILEKNNQTFYSTHSITIFEFYKDFFNFIGNMRVCKHYNKFLNCIIFIDNTNKKEDNIICESCTTLINNCMKKV